MSEAELMSDAPLWKSSRSWVATSPAKCQREWNVLTSHLAAVETWEEKAPCLKFSSQAMVDIFFSSRLFGFLFPGDTSSYKELLNKSSPQVVFGPRDEAGQGCRCQVGLVMAAASTLGRVPFLYMTKTRLQASTELTAVAGAGDALSLRALASSR
ncbi:hypothetical protein TREES_T100016232 [Tupaia chinensis]|uniref:Uncharacterized protein n=1 Tax=Tupaia chinensis TaxID=246437 RepID=L9JHM6_TUPCH|nr:hypothetical protein TREES_T100016232 [Tupaia chinensis]